MKASSKAKEAILAYGIMGSGKSHGWGEIARYYRMRGAPGTFYVVGTEHEALARMADKYPATEADPGWDTNIVTNDVTDWITLVATTNKYLSELKDGDWFVMEGLGLAWEWVRQLYVETRPGWTPPNPLDPFSVDPEVDMDWQKIKTAYYGWVQSILTSPAHVYATAHAEPLRVEGRWKDSKEAIDLYSRVGMRAITEKTAGYSFHSVLYMQHPKAKEWTITTVDDHAREHLTDEPISDFVLSWLVPVAGWSL